MSRGLSGRRRPAKAPADVAFTANGQGSSCSTAGGCTTESCNKCVQTQSRSNHVDRIPQ